MKKLLLSLSLAGAAFYTVNALVITPRVLLDRKAENTSATARHDPVDRPLRSWGPYLPGSPLSQSPKATSEKPSSLPPQQDVAVGLTPNRNSGQNLERTGAADQRAALASGIEGADQGHIEWAKLILAARVHSEASVSSPTVGFYRPGAELQVVGREDGWLLISDPLTQKRGWVLERYLYSIDGPSPHQVATDSTTQNGFSEPKPAKLALPNSKKRTPPAASATRVAEEDVLIPAPDPRTGRWERRGDRRRAGLFIFFRR